MNIYWLLGFIEGEAWFGVTIGTKMYKGKKYCWPRTEVSIAQSEEKPLMAIKGFLKEHNIQTRIYGPYEIPTPLNWKSKTPYQEKYSKMFFLKINGIEDSMKLIKLLDSLEWQTKKRLDFERWKECILKKSG